MDSLGIGGWAILAGLGAALVMARSVRRSVRRYRATQAGGPSRAGAAPELEALAEAQAALAARLEALAVQSAAPEQRLQAMAGQMLGLIRDKNATLETALAGLDQLRARMRTLEQIGEPAEARALIERLGERLDALQVAQTTGTATLETRIGLLEAPGVATNPATEIGERLAQLHAQRDAGLEAVLARLAPLETRLGALEGDRAAGAAGREAAIRLEGRLEALAVEQGGAKAELARLKAEARGGEALAGQLARLHEQKDALAEAVLARLAALEATVAGRDPVAAFAPLEARLRALENPEANPFVEVSGQLTRLYAQKDVAIEAVLARLVPLEGKLVELQAALGGLDPRLALLEGAGPFAEISEQLTRLYAQKDATVETVFARLAPLETKLAELDPASALDRFTERLEAVQGRVAALEGAENPFAEISEQLTRLYAQKDATVETVFARLAPLETKLAELDPASALDCFTERLEAVQGRVAALEGAENPFAEISEQLTRLYAQKDATVETVFARLAPLETKLAELDPASALDRFTERLEAVQGRVAALEGAENPFAEISEQLTRLYAQKDATVETVFARLAPLETKLAELDPASALDRFTERLEAVQGRVAALEGAENPFAEISEQLTRLYAQKDATVETVFARLAPLETKLAELDPASALDRFTERLEAVQGRVAALEGAENPFAEISEQLTRLYAQKDATVETVFARLAPLETKLAELDPASALDRFTERLEAVQGRVAALEGAENPFAEISEQLTRLYAQKDATVETVFARLAPLETKLAELDPASALDRFTERLEAVQGRVAALEGAENPFAEISEQLTRLYAQKDATVETVFARLAPLETKLAELDPASALDRFTERLEAVQGRVAALEGAENPFAEISEQLTRFYAQKDATVETVFARLAPLETKLAELEGGVLRLAPPAEDNPRAAVAELRERLEALQRSQGEMAVALKALEAVAADGGPLAEVADQLTRLYAQKDVGIAALHTRLAEIEARPWDPAAETARAEAQAIAVQLIAAQAAAEQTELFADRLAVLEASLPRLTAAERQALDRRGAPAPAPERAAEALDAIWALPRIVSLHQK